MITQKKITNFIVRLIKFWLSQLKKAKTKKKPINPQNVSFVCLFCFFLFFCGHCWQLQQQNKPKNKIIENITKKKKKDLNVSDRKKNKTTQARRCANLTIAKIIKRKKNKRQNGTKKIQATIKMLH
ncbi:hypothetical protein RFI_06629 [Reticulomyxa filosa]|uniref:Uncharacterized protein n=1 Tax=Reticulomyxa filosa TaxID=46433 RepID=X6NYZ0_RETFI|nr:hypothetical protein RFI_06629 [Reticulomyxa filosa]|eukprot:ETO30492.1 hypothetical protein RFI_06629 [Reticulomyxa filosa]